MPRLFINHPDAIDMIRFVQRKAEVEWERSTGAGFNEVARRTDSFVRILMNKTRERAEDASTPPAALVAIVQRSDYQFIGQNIDKNPLAAQAQEIAAVAVSNPNILAARHQDGDLVTLEDLVPSETYTIDPRLTQLLPLMKGLARNPAWLLEWMSGQEIPERQFVDLADHFARYDLRRQAQGRTSQAKVKRFSDALAKLYLNDKEDRVESLVIRGKFKPFSSVWIKAETPKAMSDNLMAIFNANARYAKVPPSILELIDINVLIDGALAVYVRKLVKSGVIKAEESALAAFLDAQGDLLDGGLS